MDVNPEEFIREVERVWQTYDAEAAAADFTSDAVQYYGAGQKRTGEELREWPRKWFAYAKDLKINKRYRSHHDDCISSTWESTYTDPETGKVIKERGAELFYMRGSKVYEHHMWQHSWPADEQPKDGELVTL